jgi:tRNA pseudouridine38-40 synthase
VSIAYEGPIPPVRLRVALASTLPRDLVVVQSAACSASFDARTDALSRSYEYRVLTRSAPSPMRAAYALHHPAPLDLDLLNQAAAATVGKHDFTAFTPSETQHSFFHRTVLSCAWHEHGDEFVLSISANAFLRHMVRIIVGTQLAVGRGDMPLDCYAALLDGAPRSDAGKTAPAHGLCLTTVSFAAGAADGRGMVSGATGKESRT